MRAQPGDVLFRIADHRVVWAIVDVAERDEPGKRRHWPARRGAEKFSRREFSGKVNLIWIRRSPRRRERRACASNCPTWDLLLIHDMYVDAEIEPAARNQCSRFPKARCWTAAAGKPCWWTRGRAVRGQARPPRRGLCRGSRRPRRGRSGRGRGQFPDRCNFESNLKGGAERLCRGAGSHDRPPHRLVGAYRVVFFGTTFAAAAGLMRGAPAARMLFPTSSDTQVIVYTECPDKAPQVIEDQVTYPRPWG